MIRRNGRAWATIAVTLSMLLGTEAVLPPIAAAEEANELSSLLFETFDKGEQDDEDNLPLTLVAAAIVNDPKEIDKLKFGTKVSPPLSGIANTLPLIKNAGFDLFEEIVPIQSWTDDDGNTVYAININHKEKALWKDLVSGKTTIWDNAKKNFNNVQKGGGPRFKPVFQVSGLFKTNTRNASGEIAAMGGMQGSVQGQYFIFTGEFSLTGMGGAKAGFRYDPGKGASIDGNVDVVMSLSPKIAGGVGVAYIGRFGVYGTGNAETSIRILPTSDAGFNHIRFTANIGLEVVALIFRVWHKDLWQGGPWDLITPRNTLRSQAEGYDIRPLFVTAADEGAMVVPLKVMADSSEWYGYVDKYVEDPSTPDDGRGGDADDDMTNESSTPQQGLRLLESGIYPDAQVRLVNVNNNAVMCWLETDASDPNTMNATRLMWSRYDPGSDTWSSPKRVNTDANSDTADFEPDLFADPDGNVHAVWLSASKDVPARAANLRTVTDLLEVRYAKLAADAEDFTPSEVVSPSEATLVAQAEEAEEEALLAQQDAADAEDTFVDDLNNLGTSRGADTEDEEVVDEEGAGGSDAETDTTADNMVFAQSDTSETDTPNGDTQGNDLSNIEENGDLTDEQELEESDDVLRAQSDDEGNITFVAQAENTEGYFRTSPQVAAYNENEVVVGWSTTPVANIVDYDGDHQVIVAKRTPKAGGGAEWTATLADNYEQDFEITSLDAGLVGSEPTVAWTYNDLELNADGSVTTSANPSKLVLATRDKVRHDVSTNNPENVNFVGNGDEGALTWSEPGTDDTSNVMVLTSTDGTPQKQLEDVDLPPNYQIDGNLQTSALISYQGWESGETEEESTTDIYGRVLTGGTILSDENLLVAHEDDLTSHDVAFVQSAPLIGLAAEQGVGNDLEDTARSADLLVARGDSLERLSIVDLDYDVNDVKPGGWVNAKVIVENAGLVPILGGANAEIIDDTTGRTLNWGTYDRTIGIGERVEIPVTINVPANFDPTTYRSISVKANFNGFAAKDSTALNLDTVLIGPDFGTSGSEDEGSGSGKGGKRTDTTPSANHSGADWGWSPIGRWRYNNGWFFDANWSNRDRGSYRGAWSSSTSSSTSTNTRTNTASTTAKATPSAAPKVERRSGPDRYATMKATVLAAFKQSDWAVLASGEGFADALSAQSLAGVHRAPVVLTATNKLSPEAKEVLKELGCKHVLVVGGNAAVSEATLAEVASICGDTRRVAGADRFQTSLAIMSETAVAGGVSDTVFVATGTNFADALSAGPASWKMTSPVVLAGANKKLNDEAVFAIKANPHIRRVVLLGGDGVVSDAIKDQLGPAYQFVRLSGADRYQTSAAIASWAADQGLGWSRAHVATGTNFADALAGAASAGVNSSCLLLADSASSPTITELKKHASEVRSVTLLGGNQAVSDEVEDYLSKQIVP